MTTSSNNTFCPFPVRSLVFYTCTAVLSLFLFQCNGTGDHLVLIEKGESPYSIVLSEKASPSEEFAAAELQTTLAEITGYALPVVSGEKNFSGRAIHVGQSAKTDSLMAGDPVAFEDEEFLIRTMGEDLLIVGGKQRGTMYGVFTFLEDYLGCRWYTDEVAVIPKKETVLVPRMEDRQKPAFEYRSVYYKHALDQSWSVRHKINGFHANVTPEMGGKIKYANGGFGHTFTSLVPPDKYYDEHPEYFSLVKGKRVKDRGQLCLTNKDLLKTVIGEIDTWLTREPDAKIVSITQNDWENYCECENCKRLDEQEGSHSGSLIAFVNSVADSLKDKYPDVYFDTFAYTYTQTPPQSLSVRDNVIVRLCHMRPSCDSHPLEACEQNADYMRDLNTWSRKGGKVYIWHYVTNFNHYQMPFPNFNSIKKDFSTYQNAGVSGLFCQGNAQDKAGEMAGLRAYVLAKLLWNPATEVDKVIEEYVQAVYEEAAPPILEYLKMMHDLAAKPDRHFDLFSHPNEVGYLGEEVLDKADWYFEEAKKLVADKPGVLKRVNKEHMTIYYTRVWLQMRGLRPVKEGDIVDKDLFTTFKKLAEENEVHFKAEGQSMDNFLEGLSENHHYVRNFKILGPFWVKGDGLLPHILPVEKEKVIDVQKSYQAAGGNALTWQDWKKEDGLYVDFKKAFSAPPDSTGIAYALCYVESPEKFATRLGVGSNDGVRVYLNDRIIHDNPASRPAFVNSDIVEATFEKGRNKLLIKVDQKGAGWGLYLSIIDPERKLIVTSE